MKNYVKTTNCSTKDGYKTGRKTTYSFDNALKGLGVVNKWDVELTVKK